MMLIIAGSILLLMGIVLVILYYKEGHESTFYEYMDAIIIVYLAVVTIFLGVNTK